MTKIFIYMFDWIAVHWGFRIAAFVIPLYLGSQLDKLAYPTVTALCIGAGCVLSLEKVGGYVHLYLMNLISRSSEATPEDLAAAAAAQKYIESSESQL